MIAGFAYRTQNIEVSGDTDERAGILHSSDEAEHLQEGFGSSTHKRYFTGVALTK